MNIISSLILLVTFLLATCLSSAHATSQKSGPHYLDEYTQKIQPLFNNRCLSCHSCFNAPCQLNLQNYEGFVRGANKLNVYDGFRTHSVIPSRLWIDGKNVSDWRQKKFFEINTSKDPTKNLFFQMIAMKTLNSTKLPEQPVASSMICAANLTEQKNYAKTYPEKGMPYGFPALKNQETETLRNWIQHGAPGPNRQAQHELSFISTETKTQIYDWEQFLNAPELRQKLVSRYLYEHLFLAHLYFKSSINKESPKFFQLVRSRAACEKQIDIIGTRRPNDDPGVSKFYYCLQLFSASVVEKTHIPYQLSPEKLAKIQKIFFAENWSLKKMPTYDVEVAENPFVAFQDIPAKARYQFLLEDAQYEINTFIKGPVCNGSNAVNSIQEQFYVFFLSPHSDNMVTSTEYANKAKDLLFLPGVWGSDVPTFDTIPLIKKLVDHREAYRQLRSFELKKNHPKGYNLNDIWDGDQKNENAVLTIIRHFDNAIVLKGAAGDISKTLFVLDYPLLERLVYNLVVNFDIFGNVGHQSLTRIYMDMIRMEAEELFLLFLPPQQRVTIRNSWYQGFLTGLKMNYIFPQLDLDYPTGISYEHSDLSNDQSKSEFIQKVLFERMNQKVRGPLDALNWKTLQIPNGIKFPMIDLDFRKITSIKASKKTPFAQFFPDIAYLLVNKKDGTKKVLTIIHHREHQNISWILAENFRLSPADDSLSVLEGFNGAYPNMFFALDSSHLDDFLNDAQNIHSAQDYNKIVLKYGVPRTQDRFWSIYDDLNSQYQRNDPVNFGYLDLSRYEL